MHKKVILLLLVAFASGLWAAQPTATEKACSTQALSQSKKSELVQYVTNKYQLQSSASLSLIGEQIDRNTCYRQVTFEGKSTLRTWDLTLYLSPDQRFLSSDIFDTSVDPIEEERRKNTALMSDLAQNKGSSKGPADAPVTIIEFSDFECPYCRKFADIMKQLAPAERDSLRIVFHHMPLQMRPATEQ
jgi:protein-disulfide isomerase